MTKSRITTCSQCQTDNRVPWRHLASTGRCGNCGAPLLPLDEPLDVDAPTFDAIIRGVKVPVLVDFWAPWCAPCRLASPEVHKLAQHSRGSAVVLKVNTDQESTLSARYRIQSIPTFLLFYGGQPVLQHNGVAPVADMQRWLIAARKAS